MKKITLAALLASAVFTSTAALADGWRIFPMHGDPGFKLEPTLAVTVNNIDPRNSAADSATAYGIDLNFNCGLIQDPQNRMRTHLIVSQADENNIEQTSFELSPRYTMPLGGGLAIGVGPSLGSFKVKAGAFDETYFGIGLAAGVDYKTGPFYAGADVRYHSTSEKNGVDNDHMVAGVKLGINF